MAILTNICGYRNINRAKQDKPDQLSVGYDRGRSNPQVFGYAAEAVFSNARFFVRDSTAATIYRKVLNGQKAHKEVYAWFIGDYDDSAMIPPWFRDGGKYAATLREVTINPKSADPRCRVFHYRDTKQPISLEDRFTVVWKNHRCFVCA